MKLTEEQRELIALIPKTIRKSKEYTDATKLVLGQIDFMHGTDFAEVNGYVFCSNDKMSEETGVSVSQVKRVVKILVNEGLITTQRGDRTKEGKEASKYWLTDLYYELANRPKPKNEPLIGGQNEIEEKNEPLDIDIELEKELNINQTIVHVTEDKNENTMNDMNKNEEMHEATPIDNMIDIFDEIEIDREAEEREREEYLQWLNDNNISNGSSGNNVQSNPNNEYVNRVWEWLDAELNYYYETQTKNTAVAQNDKICNFMEKVIDNRDRFTDGQWDVICSKVARWDSITNNKVKYFGLVDNDCSDEEIEQSSASNENSIISTGLSESEHCPSPAAPKYRNADEENEKILRQLCSDEELIAMGFEVEEPMVAYGNSSVKEAQEQFAMVLAANG